MFQFNSDAHGCTFAVGYMYFPSKTHLIQFQKVSKEYLQTRNLLLRNDFHHLKVRNVLESQRFETKMCFW